MGLNHHFKDMKGFSKGVKIPHAKKSLFLLFFKNNKYLSFGTEINILFLKKLKKKNIYIFIIYIG